MTDGELARRTGLGIGRARKLGAYAALLLKWGRSQDLTSPAGLGDIVERHLLDVVPLVEALPGGACRIADIGSGAGAPGIPVAIARPHARVTLVESRKRRAVFLRQCKIELGLGNADVFHGRAEEWLPAEAPDLLVCRAVAPLERLARMTAHLAGPGTRMAVLKGNDPAGEIARVPEGAAFAVERVDAISAPQSRFIVWLAAAA